MKLCVRCKKEKDLSEFFKEKRNNDKRQSYCKECIRQYQKLWRDKNLEYCRKRDREWNKSPKNRVKDLISSSSVDRSNLSFEYIWNRLEENCFKCEITGTPFEWEARNPRGLSIDKIDPEGEYTPNNIRLVCWWINAAMGNWGLEELKNLIKEWSDNGKA